jgi:hypothetical protein
VRPADYFFGGGAAETMISPIVLAVMMITIILGFVLPRKYVIVPYLFTVFLTPMTQTVVIGGLHFFVIRILILAAWVRLIAAKFSSPGGLFGGRLNVLDKVFVFWAVIRALAFVLRFAFEASAVVVQTGFLLDALGGYFLLRYLIRDEEDILRVIKVFAIIVAVAGAAMLHEKLAHQNVFGYLGGIPVAPGLRDGAYRCQGPFRNPILAGCFGATTLPLFVLLWKASKRKLLAALAVIGATIMVATSASSTPLMAFAGAIIAISLWPIRKKMRVIRWGFVILLIMLQLAMKAPVWFIITHFQLIDGSSNYHRAELIQQFVTHFGDWWLIGTNNNASWGWDMWDQCNQFVLEGESGGLASLVCFISMISICFSWLGRARKKAEGDRRREWFFWLLGGSMSASTIAFLGVNYFDQTQVGWYVTLAIVCAATAAVLAQPINEAATERAGAASSRISKLGPAIAERSSTTSRRFGRLAPSNIKGRSI